MSRQRRRGGDKADTQHLVWGARPVAEWLEASPEGIKRILASRQDPEMRQAARDAGVEWAPATPERLDELTQGGNHQGVVAETEPFAYAQLDQVLASLEGAQGGMILLLDQVQDVGNLGAILRSAAAFGAAAVVILTRRSAQVTAAAIRASAGQAWRVPVVREPNLVRVIERLQSEGFWVASTGVDGRGAQLGAAAA